MGGCATPPQGLQQDSGTAEEPAEHHLSPPKKEGRQQSHSAPRARGHHTRSVSPRALQRRCTPTRSYLEACCHLQKFQEESAALRFL